jgi:hypothetical protein
MRLWTDWLWIIGGALGLLWFINAFPHMRIEMQENIVLGGALGLVLAALWVVIIIALWFWRKL